MRYGQKRRLLRIVMALSLAASQILGGFGSVPGMIREVEAATGETFSEGNINYQVLDESARTVRVVQAHTTISNLINVNTVTHDSQTYTVTEIGDDAFKNCTNIASITFGENITKFGSNILSGCSFSKAGFYIKNESSTAFTLPSLGIGYVWADWGESNMYTETPQNIAVYYTQCATVTFNYNGDDANTLKAIEGLDKRVITFGFGQKNDFSAKITAKKGLRTDFELYVKGEKQGDYSIFVPGEHNVLNALASIAAVREVGVSFEGIRKGLEEFRGAMRRFEKIDEVKGITIVDDYAHHPSELAATLKAAKGLDFKRVIAVFQPFTYSRTEILMDDFVTALSIADLCVLTDIFGSREKNTHGIYTEMLGEKISGCVYFDTPHEVVDQQTAQQKDHNFGQVIDYLLENTGEGKAHLEGEVSFSFAAQCDRCLKEVIVDMELDLDADLNAPDTEVQDEDFGQFMDGYKLDVDALIRNEIVINWPLKILCKEDCRGICPVCGQDLNEKDCGCDTFVPDPRMSVLKDIFAGNKEVE